MKIIIVGGVAGGASTSTRLRRMNEKAEIVILERGEYISFANCGLPYHIGEIISERENLLVVTPQILKDTFNIDARVRHEVISIDRKKKTVKIRDLSRVGNILKNMINWFFPLVPHPLSLPSKEQISPVCSVCDPFQIWTRFAILLASTNQRTR